MFPDCTDGTTSETSHPTRRHLSLAGHRERRDRYTEHTVRKGLPDASAVDHPSPYTAA
nr:hypothetical protein JVH1_4483 [Rhodococcus sp. JVH1]